MDKLPVTDVDAQVGHASGVSVLEEYQISGLQLRLGNGCTHCPLLLAGAGQGNTMGLEDILHIPGAVEARWGHAAPEIGNADVLLRCGDDLLRSNAAIQRRRAWGHPGGLTAHEEQGILLGCPIFIGYFRQIHIIAADIADVISVDHLEPFAVNTDDVGLFIQLCLGQNAVACSGAGAKIHHAHIDPAVAKLGVFDRGGAKMVAVHVAGLQVVADLIPLPDLLQKHHYLGIMGVSQGPGCGIRLLTKPQGSGGDKADAQLQLAAGCLCVDGKTAGK